MDIHTEAQGGMGAIRAVIWDMDGVLIDSGPHHWQAWRETLSQECRRELSQEEFARTFGLRNDLMLRTVFGRELPLETAERLAELKEARYRAIVLERGAPVLPGVVRLLGALQNAGWRQAVGSSAPRANIEVVMAETRLSRYFGALISAEDVARGKPDPEPFLKAAQRLGVPARRCVVVEDAPAGIEAARRAGMACIGLLTTHANLEHQPVFHSPEDVPVELFERLVAANGRQ